MLELLRGSDEQPNETGTVSRNGRNQGQRSGGTMEDSDGTKADKSPAESPFGCGSACIDHGLLPSVALP